MSTTFGVKISSHFESIEVAFRSSEINWTNPLAAYLPDGMRVIPLDNSAQGIYTIGDIKKKIADQDRSKE
jgi:hypothetical protein